MNANEVIANRAEELLGGRRGRYARVHPNDHVNRSQSTNDVYPTALQLAVLRAAEPAVEGLEHLAATCAGRAEAFGDLPRLGRTCLQDAVPLTVRDTHAAQATAIRRCAAALREAADGLRHVPLGATAVGTGIGAPPGYRERAVRYLAEEAGLRVVPTADPFDALAHPDGHLAVATAAARAAVVLGKIAADLRLLSSGPHGGLGEVRLPAVQVGSSIMPGKVNPAIPELVMQVGFEIRGAAHVVELAVAAGELELNVMEPVVARALLGALHDLGVVARTFADRCIAGLVWNAEALDRHLAGSLAAAVEHAARDGYAAAVAARRAGPAG
jgi:aspartate ammonia-lyase